MLTSFSVAGIDTGIRKTLGCVILECAFHRSDLESVQARIKKSKLRTPAGKRNLLRLVLSENILKVVPLFSEVFDFSKENRNKVMSRLVSFLKELNLNGRTVFGVEDFLFFRLSNKYKKTFAVKPASWYVVSGLQNAIGYITGYAESSGYIVKLIKPKTWQSVVNPYHIPIAGKILNNSEKKSEADHVFSATGVALAVAVDQLIEFLDV